MTIRPEADDIIAFLNEISALDQEFIKLLIKTRFPCNEAIYNHPTVQAGRGSEFSMDAEYAAGFLGIINGFIGTIEGGKYKGWGIISAYQDSVDGPIRFRRTSDES